MAHFAELDESNVVLRVLALDNSVMTNESGERIEQLGVDFLQNLFGANTIWKQASYNTRAGIYYLPDTNEPDPDQSKAFRKNYAGIDFVYDLARDAFIPPKPKGDYWVIDEFSCTWVDTRPKGN